MPGNPFLPEMDIELEVEQRAVQVQQYGIDG
jgi:hypothetical protein